jgi:hypothetical protein
MTSIVDVIGVLRGLQKVNRALICQQLRELQAIWNNSSIRPAVRSCSIRLEETTSDLLTSCVSITEPRFWDIGAFLHVAVVTWM